MAIGVKSSKFTPWAMSKSAYYDYRNQYPGSHLVENSLVLTHPHLVERWYRLNIDTGANLLITPTNYANASMCERFGTTADCDEINRTSVSIARTALRLASSHVLLAGVLEPIELTQDENFEEKLTCGSEFYHAQIQSLLTAGVDLLLIENISHSNDLLMMLRAIDDVRANAVVPVVASFASYQGNYLLWGETLPDVLARVDLQALAGLGIEYRLNQSTWDESLSSIADAVQLPLYFSFDVQEHPEDYWSRSPYLDALALQFYAKCRALPNCHMIGGGRGTRPADVACYVELLKR